jgi:hypothetical protein
MWPVFSVVSVSRRASKREELNGTPETGNKSPHGVLFNVQERNGARTLSGVEAVPVSPIFIY